jgi:hypothetical protein
VLAACGGGGVNLGALGGKTATQILTVSVHAFHRQPSVHFVTKTVSPSQTTIEVGAASPTAASETVQAGKQPALQAMLVDKTVYLRAGNAFLQGALQLSTKTAAAYAGKWLSFHKGDPGYPSIAANLSPGAAIVDFVPEEPHLRVAGHTQFGGHTAIVVSGSPGRPPTNGIANVSLFVSTTAPYLPLGATVTVRDAEGKTIEKLASVYGKWGKKVDPTPPTGAVPFTSITGT